VDTVRLPVIGGAGGRSSIQNGREFDTPGLVISRIGCRPTGASGPISSLTLSLAGSSVLFESVGKLILPGKSVRMVTGSVRLAPVSVNSTVDPAWAPKGCGKLRVGDCGFCGIIGG